MSLGFPEKENPQRHETAKLSADDITIAITLFDRREYICQAIDSALAQTIPCRVIVVEDCGPDPTLEPWITEKYGHKITYHRNPHRRGLFDNWNACLELCETDYLSILHDDDYFLPNFVETMLAMYDAIPGQALYFGCFRAETTEGQIVLYERAPFQQPIQPIDLYWLAQNNGLGFGGHICSVHHIKEVGGFQKGSSFAGDWNMWFTLTAIGGGVQAEREVICTRAYTDSRKGSTRISRSGRDLVSTVVQRKKNFSYLWQCGRTRRLTPAEIRAMSQSSLKHVGKYAAYFAPKILAYHLNFLRHSPARTFPNFLERVAAFIWWPGLARAISTLWLSFQLVKKR